MPPPLPPPSTRLLLPPLLASLPAAAVSPQPPAALLPLLSPILRQRVQLLSSASTDPWLPLLCYDPEKAQKLSHIATSDKFEPHPVSGEVEVDWEGDVESRYRRVDEETLEARVSLRELELSVKLLWCTGDQEGGGDGWRISEVSVIDPSSIRNSAPQEWESIGEAEGRFKEARLNQANLRGYNGLSSTQNVPNNANSTAFEGLKEDDDDDDAYWAQYDNTPARTPAIKRSPAPDSMQNGASPRTHGSEDAYYAQYASVQPAMDNHDPDEASQNGHTESTLSRSTLTHVPHDNGFTNSSSHFDSNSSSHDPELLSSSSHVWAALASPSEPQHQREHPAFDPSAQDTYSSVLLQPTQPLPFSEANTDAGTGVFQPRPTSSSSSSSSRTVEKLESSAAVLGQSEIGVKQHISTSVKSLFRLARAAGMERAEFERLVRTELDVLALMDED